MNKYIRSSQILNIVSTSHDTILRKRCQAQYFRLKQDISLTNVDLSLVSRFPGEFSNSNNKFAHTNIYMQQASNIQLHSMSNI